MEGHDGKGLQEPATEVLNGELGGPVAPGGRDSDLTKLFSDTEQGLLLGVDPSMVKWSYSLRGCHLHSFNTKHLDRYNSVHFGLMGKIETSDGKVLEFEDLSPELRMSLVKDFFEKKRCVVILRCSKKIRNNFREYCAKELLPILLYSSKGLESLSQPYSKEPWLAYVKTCQVFADSVLQIYGAKDIVWVHDYQVLLVPGMIREKQPNAVIGLFIHKPFPSSELFRCLPSRKEILRGMLGANVVGFHVYPDTRHFISSCSRILGIEKNGLALEIEGRIAQVQSTVITADEDEIMDFLSKETVQEKIKNIRRLHGGKKIIIGIEKGYQLPSVVDKLSAFYKFLKMYPEWCGKVTLPFEDCTDLRSRTKITQLESQINSDFGFIESLPLSYHYRYLDQDEYYSLLTAADLGLFTPARAGLNMVVFEYITCQKENKGPLIISEFTGTAGLFPTSIRVNPSNYEEVAEAINSALSSPSEERIIKYNYLHDSLSNKNRGFWMHSFLNYLEDQTLLHSTLSQSSKNIYNSNILQSYRNANKRLIMLDYDGTIVDICKNPEDALPSQKLLQTLKIISSSKKNEVYVVSGRDTAFLEKQFASIESLGLSSEHGCFVKRPHDTKWVDLSKNTNYGWKNEVNAIFNYHTERTSRSNIEHKQCSIVWHYRNADPEFGEFQANQCKEQLKSLLVTYPNIEVLSGKRNIEVRPISVSKGNVVKVLVKRYYDSSKRDASAYDGDVNKNLCGNVTKDIGFCCLEDLTQMSYEMKYPLPVDLDFVLCAGDDRTDEDMYKILTNVDPICDVFCCHVGTPSNNTTANWVLPNPTEVNNLLYSLSQIELENH